jgi:hypothetical protein
MIFKVKTVNLFEEDKANYAEHPHTKKNILRIVYELKNPLQIEKEIFSHLAAK